MQAAREVAQANNLPISQVLEGLWSNDSTTVGQVTSQLAQDFNNTFQGISSSDAQTMATDTIQKMQQWGSSVPGSTTPASHGMGAVAAVAQQENVTPGQVWANLGQNDSTTVADVTSQIAQDYTQRYSGLSSAGAQLIANTVVQQMQQRAASMPNASSSGTAPVSSQTVGQ
jgi:hypothetical protein